jgi:hypothetical protein
MSDKVKGVLTGYYVDGPNPGKGKGGVYYKHSIYVDGEKYGAFGNKGEQLANKGDIVEFEWEQKGQYKNFNGSTFKVLERATAEQAAKAGGKSSTNDSIARQNALRHATGMVLAFADTYKRPDQMATEAVEICRDILFPYINDGTVCGDVEPGNNRGPDGVEDSELPF